jgi:hypothetical protein
METTLNETTATLSCRSCQFLNTEDAAYCSECGYPFNAIPEDRDRFIQQRDYSKFLLTELNQKIKKVQNMLFILAGLFGVVGIFMFFSNQENPAALLIVYLIIGGIYTGLGFYTKKQPLAAIVSAFCLYLLLMILDAIEDPVTIFKGIIIKIIIIGTFIKGVKAANEAQKIKGQLNLS